MIARVVPLSGKYYETEIEFVEWITGKGWIKESFSVNFNRNSNFIPSIRELTLMDMTVDDYDPEFFDFPHVETERTYKLAEKIVDSINQNAMYFVPCNYLNPPELKMVEIEDENGATIQRVYYKGFHKGKFIFEDRQNNEYFGTKWKPLN